MSTVPDITLNNGTRIPQLGFGTYQIDPSDTAASVENAFAVGYRHIDTAQMYGNEAEVGQAVASSGIPRDQLWITTKCDNGYHGYDDAQRALDGSLRRLGLDHVDLYLIHWPLPGKDLFVDTWKGFERAYGDGRARAIGVSNFQEPHLDRLLAESETVPAVNQIEVHPHLVQEDMRAVDRRLGIATEAWSPLGQGKGLLDEPILSEIAARHDKSPGQVVLRWHVQRGDIVFPKSVTPARVRENFEIFDFALDDAEMAAVSALDRGQRVGPDPDTFAR